MSDKYPRIAKKGPYIVDLKAGTYWWCTCGKSKDQPFCDGSHKGTEFSPLKFTVDNDKKYGLCGCKYSEHKPFCDGKHGSL